MSDLFRKEALSRRSRALFGDVILRAPLPSFIVFILIAAILLLIGVILFVLPIGELTVMEWLYRDR